MRLISAFFLGALISFANVSALADERSAPKLDLYGDPLPEGAQARLGTIRGRHSDTINRVMLSADGKLATWSGDGELRLSEAATGKPLSQWSLANASLHGLAFLPEGRSLAIVGDYLGQMHLWDFAAREPMPKLAPPPAGGFVVVPLEAAAFDPKPHPPFAISQDGRLLVGTVDRGKSLQVWEVSTPKTVAELKVVRKFASPFDQLGWMRFLPGNEDVMALTRDGEVSVWNTASGERKTKFAAIAPVLQGYSAAAAMSSNAERLAVGDGAKSVRLYDLAAGKETRRFELDDVMHALAFAPAGDVLATAGRDNAISLWNIASGERIAKLEGHRSWIESIAFSSDGALLASGGQDYRSRVWSLVTGKELPTPDGHDFRPFVLSLSSDGKTAIAAGWEGVLRSWDTATGKLLRSTSHAPAYAQAIASSPDGAMLALGVGGDEGNIHLYDSATGELLRKLPAPKEIMFNSLAFSPTGDLLASASREERLVRIWKPATGEELRQWAVPESVPGEHINCLAFSPDGRTIATGSGNNFAGFDRIRIWSSADGKPLREILGQKGGVGTLAFSPDGRLLVCGGYATTVGYADDGRDISSSNLEDALQVFEITTSERLRGFPANTEPKAGGRRVTHAAFSPGGGYIIAAEETGIGVYNVETGRRVKWFAGHRGPVRHAALSGDGKIFCTLGDDMTGLVWNGRDIWPPMMQE